MIYKTCPKCNLNLILDNGEMCIPCKKTINPYKGILNNHELMALKGKQYQIDLSGYGKYLMDRNYSTYSKQGNMTTTMSYVNAIVYIAKLEKLTFTEMYESISVLTRDYGLNGSKKDLGERSKGIWRCALDRLKDFSEYISMSNDTVPNKNPNVEQIRIIKSAVLCVSNRHFRCPNISKTVAIYSILCISCSFFMRR